VKDRLAGELPLGRRRLGSAPHLDRGQAVHGLDIKYVPVLQYGLNIGKDPYVVDTEFRRSVEQAQMVRVVGLSQADMRQVPEDAANIRIVG
jgi:hypothetical protein